MGIAAVAAIAACLPDLGDLPPDTSTTPTKTCGDGIIGPGEECDPGDKPSRGCVECKIVCEGTRDEKTGHCYFERRPHEPGYTSALRECFGSDAHLVTVGNDPERDFVEAIAHGRPYWLGLEFQSSQGAFMPTSLPGLGLETGWPQPPCRGPCSGCYGYGVDGGGLFFIDGGVPDDDGGNENNGCPEIETCVVALTTPERRWTKVLCGDDPAPQMTTICEREPPGIAAQNCGTLPCFTLRTGGKLYSVHASLVPADQAICEDGATLLLLDSDAERIELVRALSQVPSIQFQNTSLWIGLHHDDASNAWIWDDRKPRSDVHLWGDIQPAAGAVGRAYLHLDVDYASGLVQASASPANAGFLCQRTQ